MFVRRPRSQSSKPASGANLEATSPVDPEATHDLHLLAAARRGELASFNALVTRHERAVFNVCLRLLHDVEAAEDAAQDTFIKAWSALDSYRGGLVRAWLLRIATNRCLDQLRTQRRRPTASFDAQLAEVEPVWSSQVDPADGIPEAVALRMELGAHLERALAELPDEQRLVVILADIQGYPYDEVADITGVAVGTVKSRLSRARARLRDILLADPASRELFARFGRLNDG